MSKHIFHHEETGTVEILDDRYYYSEIKEQYYASVTTVLDAYPKGFGFTNWLKQVGFNADIIVAKAGEEGSLVHDLIQQYLEGRELYWYVDGVPKYDMHIWKMLLKFVEFWEVYKPEIQHIEKVLISDNLQIGGRLDLICRFNNENWLIDYKTSNALYRNYELQLAAYRQMCSDVNIVINRCAVLWLKAATRGPDKTGKKIQGRGWQLIEPKGTQEDDFKIFQKVADIWRDSNTVNPANLILPNKIQKNMNPLKFLNDNK